MYTPDCVNCKQDSEGQSSEEKNQNEILMSVEELVSRDMQLASDKRKLCLKECGMIKMEILDKISFLIGVLRKREQELCTQVDEECYSQMAQIDNGATVQCIDKLLAEDSELEEAPCKPMLVFNCDFDLILHELKKFGELSFEDPCKAKQKQILESKKMMERNANAIVEHYALTDIPVDPKVIFDEICKTDINNLYMENPKPISNDLEKRAWDFQTVEGDFEMISTSDFAAIPSELPSESRFSFARKRLSFPSLRFLENNSASNHSISSETKSQACIQPGMCEVEKFLPFDEQAGQESSSKAESSLVGEDGMRRSPLSSVADRKHFSERPHLRSSSEFESSIISDCEGRKKGYVPVLFSVPDINSHSSSNEYADRESSNRDDRKWRNMAALLSVIDRRYRPAFNEQSIRDAARKLQAKSESSIIRDNSDIQKRNLTELCVPERKEPLSQESSNTAGQGHDPSATLLASFRKYLEKNPTDEWLVPEKSSEHWLFSGNSCRFNGLVPFSCENSDQWLSTEKKQEIFSDWLYTPQV